jgi:hypothetical protein
MSPCRQTQNGIDVVRNSVATGTFSIMRLLAALSAACFCAAAVRAELPGTAANAIKAFRADGARGWAYTQTTDDEGRKTIERFDPGRPEFVRWTLVEKDGSAPSAPELQHYRERKARRVLTAGPPPLKDQLDLDTAELLEETPVRWRYRFHLKPGGSDDRAAVHLRATLTISKAAAAIETLALENIEPFSPAFFVKIELMRTVMTYSLPTAAEPSHLLRVEAHVRGRAVLKSLEQSVVVTYSDFEQAWIRKE